MVMFGKEVAPRPPNWVIGIDILRILVAEGCDWDVLWRTITRQEIWTRSRQQTPRSWHPSPVFGGRADCTVSELTDARNPELLHTSITIIKQQPNILNHDTAKSTYIPTPRFIRKASTSDTSFETKASAGAISAATDSPSTPRTALPRELAVHPPKPAHPLSTRS